jgi:adsorption protein B
VLDSFLFPDWLPLIRDCCIVIAWIAAIVFLISGLEDLCYDIGVYVWKIYRRIKYRKRERLSLTKIKSRVQQRIAIFVPAWSEGSVIGEMLDNIIQRVEYRNYYIFVGTYPNDEETQAAVNALALRHPQVINVVNTQEGPTNKANCMNSIYRTMKQFEQTHDLHFDLVVMHDAEDVVHPYSLLLYNYLIPRVDAIQLPILPLPVAHTQLVHWSYADEFAENHMKDMVVREKMVGLVPFAGVGTGFSRSALALLEEQGGDALFNERTLTEDYSFGMKMKSAGLQTVFVNLVMDDETDRWYTPLAKRRGFLANWSYFPRSFARAVRQKTRWIIGISLQEWEISGWQGSTVTRFNLMKDRKVFITASVNLLAYILVTYVILAELGERGYIALHLLPIIHKGTLLYTLILIDTVIMLLRALERVVFVTMVYGLLAGVLAVPRLIFGNILNGVATYRALLQYLKARRGGQRVPWDKTEHLEGVGHMPSEGYMSTVAADKPPFIYRQLVKAVTEADDQRLSEILETIPRELPAKEKTRVVAQVEAAARSEAYLVRAMVARVSGFLQWEELFSITLHLLQDREWLVRANAARSLLLYPDLAHTANEVRNLEDAYAWEVFTRSLNMNLPAQQRLIARLDAPELATLRASLFEHSQLMKIKYDRLHQDDAVVTLVTQ